MTQTTRRRFLGTTGVAFAATGMRSSAKAASSKPNVIIVITDDQGYGDLGCHGNPILKTPNLDRFHAESARLTNYHVDPTCAPTRSALMTGRYSDRVGVWHTILGRSMLRRRETTMADIFQANGYETAILGKWHLGDAYPFRPEDRGFQHVVIHGGGGITQTSDFWGNDYFDDTYNVNGTFKKFKGYCTDIWFDEAMKHMKTSKAAGKPFFTYLCTNAPHGPKRAPERYKAMYSENADFFGMITNIDDNFARLRTFLAEEGLEDNTILIFTTDNGSAGGTKYWTAGLKDGKGSQYDGGHRVPFFIRWPGGKLTEGRDIDQLTAHLDILPTFIDLLGLTAPKIEFDGTSIKEILYGDETKLRDRTLVVESQRIVDPEKWRKCSVMTDRWRLVDGKHLFDIHADRGQKNNVATQHPEIVEKLRAEYDLFWNSVSKDHHLFTRMVIGSPHQNPTVLTGQDVIGSPIWSQSLVIWKQGKEGFWAIEAERAGNYEISIRRWPAESDLGLNETYLDNPSLGAQKAYLEIGGQTLEQTIPSGAKEVTFKLKLDSGELRLNTGFISKDGKKVAANFAYILNTDLRNGSIQGWQSRQGLGLPKAEGSTDFPLGRAGKKKK